MIGRNRWPYRIVIVEDSLEVRALFRHILEEAMDMAVVGEASCEPASIDLVHLLGPDVVVIGPGPELGEAVGSIESVVAEHPSTMIITVRLAQSIEDQLALVRAGAQTLLEFSGSESLPYSIRRADRIQQELSSIRTS